MSDAAGDGIFGAGPVPRGFPASAHRRMVADRVRVEAYRTALRASVPPGGVVLDVGTGTGILALLAADAGAARVYGVEIGDLALAEAIVARHPLRDRIRLLQGDAGTIVLPEPVDVIVSEWMGSYALDENTLGAVLTARDRWLRPGGCCLPTRFATLVAPVEEPVRVADWAFLSSRPYGVDVGPLLAAGEPEMWRRHDTLAPATLLAAAQTVFAGDLRTMAAAEASGRLERELGFRSTRDGHVTGLAAWFEVGFPDGTVLGNGPAHPATHWGTAIFPLTAPVAVTAGMPLTVRFGCDLSTPDRRWTHWAVQVNGGAWELHTDAPALEVRAATCLDWGGR